MIELVQTVIASIIESINTLGYTGVFLLAFLASSVLPVPSQIALIPAGYLAFTGSFNLAVVIAIAALGTVLGALTGYYAAILVGRAYMERHYASSLVRVENFFNRHGEVSVLLGRLVSGVRHYISIPAGLARMPVGKFILYTLCGGVIYDSAQIGIGYMAAGNEALIKTYSQQLIVVLTTIIVLVIGWHGWRNYMRRTTRVT